MVDRILSFVVAVSLALLVWIYARSRDQEVIDNVAVPVQVVVNPRQADNYSVEVTGQSQVVVSFSGPPQRIRELQGMLQRKEMHIVSTITVPDERLRESRYTDHIQIEAADIHAPPGVTPIILEGRNRIPFTLHKLTERRLPVRFEPFPDSPNVPVIVEPTTVLVRGPQEVLERMPYARTEPSELPTRPAQSATAGFASAAVALVEHHEGRPLRMTPNRVTIRVPVRARKVYELIDVPVQFLCPPSFHLRPKFLDGERGGRVNLKIQGPVQDEPPKIYVFIDLSRGRFTSGLNHEPLQLQLPKDFQLAQDPPRVMAFELLPADFVPGGLGIDRGAGTSP
jgi:hypothetical protein